MRFGKRQKAITKPKSITPLQTDDQEKVQPGQETDQQKVQYFRLIEDIARKVLKEANPSKEQMQDLIECGGKVKEKISPILRDFLLKNKHYLEEGWFSLHYPKAYVSATPIKQQIDFLVKEFGLNGEQAYNRASSITRLWGEYEWFAVPRFQLLVPNEPNNAIQYCASVQIILDKIGKTRKLFQHFRDIDHYHLKMSERALDGLKKLEQQQFASDILIFPAQVGREYSGKSAARAIECFRRDEYGMNSFFGSIITLTNPHRFSYDGDLSLSMLCVGDVVETQFTKELVSLFSFFFNELQFDTTSFHEYPDEFDRGNFLCLGSASFLVFE